MPLPPRLPRLADSTIAASLAALTVGVTWYVTLMRDAWTAAALSPLCGHASLLVSHCAPCYAALSLALGGGLTLIAGVAAMRMVRALALT
jgi:hypothetical protein